MQYSYDFIIDKTKTNSSKMIELENLKVFPTNYVLAIHENLKNKSLSDLLLALDIRNQEEKSLIVNYFKKKNIFSNIKYEINDFDQLLYLIEDKMAIGILPKFTIPSNEHLIIKNLELPFNIFINYVKDKLNSTS